MSYPGGILGWPCGAAPAECIGEQVKLTIGDGAGDSDRRSGCPTRLWWTRYATSSRR
jgi:hypothetical protein